MHQLSLNSMDALRAGRRYDPMGMLTPDSQASGTDDAEADPQEIPEDYWDVTSAGAAGDPVLIPRGVRLDAVEAARLARNAGTRY